MCGQAVIVRRHSPDWSGLAADFARTGRYDSREFLPDPRPSGFPDSMDELIGLWNESFGLSFFQCRARLAEMSLASCHEVEGARVLDATNLSDVARGFAEGSVSVCFFVDDDDWYSPHLVREIGDAASGGHAVRWGAPIFRGALIQRPVHGSWPRCSVRAGRLARRIRRRIGRARGASPEGLPVESIDFLFQTNNYGVTRRLADAGVRLDEVVDHVRASRVFDRRPIGLRVVTRPEGVWSMTNKHPCSATMLAVAGGTRDPRRALRSSVERFLLRGRALRFPPSYAWSRPWVAGTLQLFEEALG